MKWAKAIVAITIIISLFSIVGNMDYKLKMREEAWKSSVQAINMEQERIQNDIILIREQLIDAEEQLYAQNMLIWDIRDRLHLDLDLELKNE